MVLSLIGDPPVIKLLSQECEKNKEILNLLPLLSPFAKVWLKWRILHEVDLNV